MRKGTGRKGKSSGFESHITFLNTKDLEATTRFYDEVLGLTLVLDQGGCRIFQVAVEAYVGFCKRETLGPTDGVILTLVTDDVDEWSERLSLRGVSLETPPRHNPEYNIYHCFLRDPNGYLVEIQRFEDPNWKAGPR
jgi:catechol 2,3-dioxygenase-like lactoylglutathione lyase family enzyme